MFKLIESLLSPKKDNNNNSKGDGCSVIGDRSPSPTKESMNSHFGNSAITSGGEQQQQNSSSTSSSASSSASSSPPLSSVKEKTGSGFNINHYRCDVPIDNLIKILVVGGSHVGKSSLIRRYLQECFTREYIQTFGIDLLSMILKPLPPQQQQQQQNQQQQQQKTSCSSSNNNNNTNTTTINGNKNNNNTLENEIFNIHLNTTYTVQFWDIAYPESKGKNLASIINGTNGIILVFDSSNANSIVALDEWKAIIKKSMSLSSTKPNIPIAIFANKSDLGDPVISANDLDHYCKTCGYNLWKFTSSKKDIGVKDGIDRLLELVLDVKKLEIEATKRTKASIIVKQHKSKKERIISQSLPSILPSGGSTMGDPTSLSPNSKRKLQLQQQQQTEILKINELQQMTTEFYEKISIQLDDLLQKSMGQRYQDISMLQKQRTHEYVKIQNSLKKILQPPQKQQISGRSKVTKEMIQSTLEQSIKKWNTLIENLQLESTLNESSLMKRSIFITSGNKKSILNNNNQNNENNNNQQQFELSMSLQTNSDLIHNINNNNNISKDFEDDLSETSSISSKNSNNSSINNNNNNVNNNYKPISRPNISLSASYHPTININNSVGNHHHHHHHHKSSSRHGSGNSNKWKMGFGFRNNGKNSSSIAFPSSNYSLDTDNPVSSSSTISSTMSSSSSSSSSDGASSTNSSLVSSPSILPNSYNLTVHIPPEAIQLSTSSTSSINNN